MFTTRILQLAALTGALLFSTFSHAQVAPATGSVHLSADWGNTIGYELSGDANWHHGVDGTMYGNDHITRANDGVNLFFVRDDQTWLFQFVAPQYDQTDDSYDGQPLKVGMYNNVMGDWRYEPMNAGMLVSSPMGQVVEWSGWFNVLDIAYGQNGDLSRFAVDFMQFDTTNQSGPALRGSLRYNVAMPMVAVPEPGTWLLMLGGLGLLAVAVRVKPGMRRGQAA